VVSVTDLYQDGEETTGDCDYCCLVKNSSFQENLKKAAISQRQPLNVRYHLFIDRNLLPLPLTTECAGCGLIAHFLYRRSSLKNALGRCSLALMSLFSSKLFGANSDTLIEV
jgi:hypothetical protein